jgi:hypothetical protein
LVVNGSVALATLGAMALGTAGPAAAATAGAQTGWEYSPVQADSDFCGLPQSGVYLHPNDEFKLTDAVTGTVTDILIAPSLAAPQGAAPAPNGCGNPLLPIVPGPIAITNVTIGGVACSGVSGTFTRVNTTVAFNFTVAPACGGATTYVIGGSMNVCAVPIGPFATQPNPECAGDANASSHLVTAYTAV